MKKKKVTEWCSHCDREVKIHGDRISKCPYCKTSIRPCMLCDMDIVNCNDCKFDKAIEVLKKELFIAVEKNLIELIKATHYSGFDLNINNQYNESLLCVAIQKGNVEIVDFLISSGAVVNTTNRNNKSLLEIASFMCTLGKEQILIHDALIRAGA